MAMQRRPMPVGFAEDGGENMVYLMRKYHCTYYQIIRWREELGLPLRKQTGKAVIQMDMNGNEIGRYPSFHAAARVVGGNYENISCAARGKREKAYGFKWRELDENNIS